MSSQGSEDGRTPGRMTPAREDVIALGVVLALAIGAAVAAAVLDWGWFFWIVALLVVGIAAVAAVAAFTRDRRLRAGAVAVAVAILAIGVLGVKIGPWRGSGELDERVAGVGAGVVVLANEDGTSAYDGDGEVVWTTELFSAEVFEDIALVVEPEDREVVALDLASGEELWRLERGYEAVGYDGDVLALTNDEESVIGVDARSGVELWRTEAMLSRQNWCTPAGIDYPDSPIATSWLIEIGDFRAGTPIVALNVATGMRSPVDLTGLVGASTSGDTLAGIRSDGLVELVDLNSGERQSRSMRPSLSTLCGQVGQAFRAVESSAGSLVATWIDPQTWEVSEIILRDGRSGGGLYENARYGLFTSSTPESIVDTVTGESFAIPARGTLSEAHLEASDSDRMVAWMVETDLVGSTHTRVVVVDADGLRSLVDPSVAEYAALIAGP